MRITFREISSARKVKMACIACGKSLQRMVRVHQTINPFNKLADGPVKTERDIRAEFPNQLIRETEFVRKHCICRNCENAGHRINFKGEHVSPITEK